MTSTIPPLRKKIDRSNSKCLYGKERCTYRTCTVRLQQVEPATYGVRCSPLKENAVNGRTWVILLATLFLIAGMCFVAADMVTLTNQGQRVPLSDFGLMAGLLAIAVTNVAVAWPKNKKD